MLYTYASQMVYASLYVTKSIHLYPQMVYTYLHVTKIIHPYLTNSIQGCIQKFQDSTCKKKFAYLGY